jgi:hypothetical protein
VLKICQKFIKKLQKIGQKCVQKMCPNSKRPEKMKKEMVSPRIGANSLHLVTRLKLRFLQNLTLKNKIVISHLKANSVSHTESPFGISHL